MSVITIVFFLMIITQSLAYLWFQAKGGVVSHRNYIIVNACFMVGQSAQAVDSFLNGAWASFSVAIFFFVMTSMGIIKRYLIMKQDSPNVVG